MSGLLGMLSLAARSLDAQRFGLDVVGQNIANVNTAGYSKRVAEFAAVPPVDRFSAGGGVEITGARAMRDRLIDARVRLEYSRQQREDAISRQLAVVEVGMGTGGASLDSALDDFFDAFATLADTPLSATARQGVILQGEALGRAFGDLALRLDGARRDADLQVRGAVDQVNLLAERIAALNAQIAGAASGTPAAAQMKDEINQAVQQLAGYVSLNVIERETGGYDIDIAGGRPLVIGERAYALGTVTGSEGLAQVTAGGVDVTAALSGGTIGGLLHVRDALLPDYMARLDRVAYDVVQAVNGLHQSGFDANGAPGVAFFQPVTLAGAAKAVRVSADLTADGGGALVAASGTAGVAGDTTVARALAALREQPIANGGTASASEAWGQLVFQVGRDRAAAAASERTQSEVLRQLQNLQSAVSGISLDEEAADMLRFQRGYEANARFFTTVDRLLETLLGMVR